MAVLALALEGLAIFGLILFVVLWLMHFMSIIYTSTKRSLASSLTPFVQIFRDTNEVPSQLSPLEAEEAQFPQPFLIREMLRSLNHLCYPPLDLLQELHVSCVLRSPELDTDRQPIPNLENLFHGEILCGVQPEAPLAQHDAISSCPIASYLGEETDSQLAITSFLVAIESIGLSPSIQIPLQSLPALQQVNIPTQLSVICKLTEGALDPLVQIVNKDTKDIRRLHLNKKATDKQPYSKLPGVSLLKPLKGVDPNLINNLETFFELDYPKVYHDDPAIDVCKKLLGKYPNVDARLFIGGKKVGINPKINNLMPGYEVAKYDLIWICDSGIRVTPDTLTDMANQMTEKVGLVHGLPYVADRQGFAATLEQVYFGTSHPRSYISANLTGFKCVTGMSCLMRKDVLDQAGGLIAFAQYIAEDYFMAKAIADRGWKFAMATQVAMQNSGSYSISQFQSRMIRQERRASAKPMCQLELMAISYAANLWVNGRGQAHVPLQEANKLNGSTKQELSKEIFSLDFDMKRYQFTQKPTGASSSSLEDKGKGSHGALMATIMKTTSRSVSLLPCLGVW
ncbi:hypothetical protein BTVI_40416 [Pitangus sulphuratus]|nr:hypothetical protein BTVI_40416 [Pitangus sulphuratus]